MQEWVWKVYDQRWGSWYIICNRLLMVAAGCESEPWQRQHEEAEVIRLASSGCCKSSPGVRSCGRPWTTWSRCSATCRAAQPPPPSLNRPTGGFLRESTFRQLPFEKEIQQEVIHLAQLQLTWIFLFWSFVQILTNVSFYWHSLDSSCLGFANIWVKPWMVCWTVRSRLLSHGRSEQCSLCHDSVSTCQETESRDPLPSCTLVESHHLGRTRLFCKAINGAGEKTPTYGRHSVRVWKRSINVHTLAGCPVAKLVSFYYRGVDLMVGVPSSSPPVCAS